MLTAVTGACQQSALAMYQGLGLMQHQKPAHIYGIVGMREMMDYQIMLEQLNAMQRNHKLLALHSLPYH